MPSSRASAARKREDALAMRPHRQMAVLIEREPARGRDRGMREIAARISRLEALLALRIGGRRRAERAVDRRPLQEPVGFLLRGSRRFDVLPRDMIVGGGAGPFHRGLVVADDGEEIAGAHEFDSALGGALDGGLVDGGDPGAAIGLAHHARMHHAVELHVVDEGRRAEDLVRQVEASGALADGLERRSPVCARRRRSHRPRGSPRRRASNSPGRSACRCEGIWPSRTESSLASQPSTCAACARNSARTSAKAWRKATPPNWIDWLPAV